MFYFYLVYPLHIDTVFFAPLTKWKLSLQDAIATAQHVYWFKISKFFALQIWVLFVSVIKLVKGAFYLNVMLLPVLLSAAIITGLTPCPFIFTFPFRKVYVSH